MSTPDSEVRLLLENYVSSGRRIHLMCQNPFMLSMLIFLTEVLQQQTTTVAILIHRGQEASGATQLIQACVGNYVTFRCVTLVSCGIGFEDAHYALLTCY